MARRVIPAVGDEFVAREGLAPAPEPWEDGLRADTGRGSFEWWYFDAHLDDGATAVVVFATKPLLQRKDPLTPMVALTITRPDGHKLSALPLYPPGQFQAASERCDVRIGPSWARGDLRHYELHAEAGELGADLTFDGLAPAWRPGAGKNFYDDALTRYFAWLPAIPFGTVTGTLTYGGATHRVTGTGYHDHNWGNIGLDQVMSHWYWGRAHVADYTAIFVEMVPNRAYSGQRLPVFMLAKRERILTGDGGPLTLEIAGLERHVSGHSTPRQLGFSWQTAAGQVHIALRQPQIIEATSLLGLLPAWKRCLARLVANPYYFRFNADLEMTIDLAGVRDTVRGSALYELMILR